MNKQDALRAEALDKLQSLESTVSSIRRDLEAGKLHRLSETGHLILLAPSVRGQPALRAVNAAANDLDSFRA